MKGGMLKVEGYRWKVEGGGWSPGATKDYFYFLQERAVIHPDSASMVC